MSLDGPSDISAARLQATRRSLHAIAEWLMAGPQYQRSGTIRLRVAHGGIETSDGLVRLSPVALSSTVTGHEVRVPVQGTIAKMGDAVGLKPTRPDDLYSDHAELAPTDELRSQSTDLESLIAWFKLGDEALREFAPDESPVLWPEHFDLAITVDEVNFGVSLGDAFHQLPYAYIGPWAVREGAFWNAPFGAARAASDFPDAQSLAAFFAKGAGLAATDPPAAGA